jgi:hypothetical protein
MTSFSNYQIRRFRKNAIRISDLDRKIADLRYKVSAFRFLTLLRKFDPEQPRDEQGRWTDEADVTGSTGASNPLDAFAAMRGSEAECEAQYERDSLICRLVQTMSCWQQAMARRAACVAGSPIPPLIW